MPKTDNLPPRSKDSLKTILVQIAHHQSKDNPSLPNGFPQKVNSKGFKFCDVVINYNGSKGYVIGHTRCRCIVVVEPIYRPPGYLCVCRVTCHAFQPEELQAKQERCILPCKAQIDMYHVKAPTHGKHFCPKQY